MEIKDILLKKGEIPVVDNHVFVPIHPRLLNRDVRIDENLAFEVFPKAAKEWYKDMAKHVKTTDNEQTKYLFNQVGKKINHLLKRSVVHGNSEQII